MTDIEIFKLLVGFVLFTISFILHGELMTIAALRALPFHATLITMDPALRTLGLVHATITTGLALRFISLPVKATVETPRTVVFAPLHVPVMPLDEFEIVKHTT